MERPPVAAPRMGVTVQPLEPAGRADVAMPAAVTRQAQAHDLFVEMHRIGMIRQPADIHTIATPKLPAGAIRPAAPDVVEKTEGNIDPKTAPVAPSNDVASLSRVAPGVFVTEPRPGLGVKQGFAPTMDARVATATAVAAPVAAAAPSWQPVAYGAPVDPRATQIADADPPPSRVAETAGRAPIAAVERAALPAVQPQRVVPLTIARKATDDAPAVVVPAVSPAGTQVAGTLPPLPALPPLPGETAAAAPPPPPPPVPAVKSSSSKPLSAPMPPPPAPPPLPDLARSDVPLKAPPGAAEKAAAPEAKLSRAALHRAAPAEPQPALTAKSHTTKAVAAKPGSGRYLVLHSFREASRAERLAQQYSHLDAKVASVRLHGQTWHRVVVRDGAAQRSRLASDGVREYWPVTL